MAINLNKGATVELVKALSDDIRTLPDGTKATSAGDAVRRQENAIRNDLNYAVLLYNPFDLLRLNSIAANGTHNGITYAFSGNQCTVTGTSTGASFKNICDSGSRLPDGMKAGKPVYFKYSTDDSNVRLALFFRDANNTPVGGTQYLISDRTVTVPQTARRFIARIDVLSGATVNTTVEFAALTELTHDGIIEQLNGVNTEFSKRIYAKNANIYVSDSSITLSDIIEDGFYVISTNWTVTDAPADLQVTALTVQHFSTTFNAGFVKQTVESCVDLSAKKYYRFSNYNGTSWSNWHEITSGVTQTINRYENTYNVTANPTITSDTNNYLASTDDTTDVTAEIVTMLTQTGVCHLGAGVFYVSGIDMPDDATLTGIGSKTVVRLNGSGSYAVKMSHRNTVSDLTIEGSASNITLNENVGTRHGILWQGDYTQTQNQSDATTRQPSYGILSNLRIRRFTGGGITCSDTGYGTINFIEGTNIIVNNCNAGINIAYWSEFHKFTNVRTYGCYYGCINNGGNNTFANCDFSTCKLGFLMDNTNGQSPNNSHGSAVGCVFNHTDSNNGVGIKIINCNNGYIFTGCHIWFSQVDIQDSSGIVFSSCEFGSTNAVITVNGGGAVLFANNMHGAQPTKAITNNNAVRFVNCYVRSDGTAVE